MDSKDKSDGVGAVPKLVPEFEHRTPDIYLAAFLVLEGAQLAVERNVGGESKVTFVLTGGKPELAQKVRDYYSGCARCDPNALKHRMADIKDVAFGAGSLRK